MSISRSSPTDSSAVPAHVGEAVERPGDVALGPRCVATRTWSEGQAAGTETAVKVDRTRPRGCRLCPPGSPRTGTCAAARSPGLVPILSRFCHDLGLSCDKPLNSGSQGPPRHHPHHITNVCPSKRRHPVQKPPATACKWNPAGARRALPAPGLPGGRPGSTSRPGQPRRTPRRPGCP